MAGIGSHRPSSVTGWQDGAPRHGHKARTRPAVACRPHALRAVVRSARFRERLAVDPRLALQIVDRDVGVVPREPGSNAEALGQVDDTILGEPRLGGCAALPEVDAPAAGVAIEVVFSDQTLRSKPAVDGGCRGTTLHSLLLGSFRQVELDDDDAVAHERLLHSSSSMHDHRMPDIGQGSGTGPEPKPNIHTGESRH